MKKEAITEKRLTALYNYANTLNSHQKGELLTLVLAIINNKQIKIVCDELNIKY